MTILQDWEAFGTVEDQIEDYFRTRLRSVTEAAGYPITIATVHPEGWVSIFSDTKWKSPFVMVAMGDEIEPARRHGTPQHWQVSRLIHVGWVVRDQGQRGPRRAELITKFRKLRWSGLRALFAQAQFNVGNVTVSLRRRRHYIDPVTPALAFGRDELIVGYSELYKGG